MDKKVTLIAIGGGANAIADEFVKNYNDINIKVVASDTCFCGMRREHIKHKLPLTRVYAIYKIVDSILKNEELKSEGDRRFSDGFCCVGTSGNMLLGEYAAFCTKDEIQKELSSTDKVIFLGVLGQGTAGGAIRQFVKVAEKLNKEYVSLVVTDIFPSKVHKEREEATIDWLKENSSNLNVVDTDEIISELPENREHRIFELLDFINKKVCERILEFI